MTDLWVPGVALLSDCTLLLQDMFEQQNLNVSYYADLEHPVEENHTMSLWQLGNHYIMSAREVLSNQDRMAGSSTYFGPNTTDLQINRHWYFVVNNGPSVLFEAYKKILGGLLVRAMGQVSQVNQVNVILLVVEVNTCSSRRFIQPGCCCDQPIT
jgi:hypothetical protein